MNGTIFHATKVILLSWLYAIIVISVILLLAGKQALSWVMMKLYEFFVQHK